jgi:hypothetical protein
MEHARVWVKSEEIEQRPPILNLVAMDIVVSIDAKLSFCVLFLLF